MKTKINFIIIATISFIMAMIFVFVKTKKWESYETPQSINHVSLGYWKAEDMPEIQNGRNTTSYYYEVIADVVYSQDTWPSIKTEYVKSDTILLLHDCSGE